MEALKYLSLGLEILVSVLLVGIVLLQRSKDQGLGLAFGAGMGEALFGAEAGTILSKATVVLAVVFMLNTIALAKIFSARTTVDSVMRDKSGPPAAAVPTMPAGMPAAADLPAGAGLTPSAGLPPVEGAPAEAGSGDAGAVPMAPVVVPESPAAAAPSAVPEAPATMPEATPVPAPATP